MDLRSFLLDLHALAHTAKVSGLVGTMGEKPVPDAAWARISEAQIRVSPDGHTSATWLLWHMARGEDLGVNALVRGVPEVFDREGWAARLGVGLRDVGTGMSHDEAARLSNRIDPGILKQYRDAVGQETRSWLTTADLSVLDRPIAEAGERVAASLDFVEQTMRWAESYFPDKTGGWFVMRLAIWHNFFHLGHAEHVMRSVGFDQRAAATAERESAS